MLSNHLKVIFRQLTRNKAFSIINLTGLITGIVVCLFVVQFIWFERSFERFNVNADHTYRINLYNTSNGTFTSISPGTVSGLAYAMKQSIPGIESIGRISSKTKGVVSSPQHQKVNLENEIVFADPSIINLLGVDLIYGDQVNVLKDQRSIFISATTALKYFGEANVVGKVLEVGFSGATIETKPFQVKGVFKDIPANTHQHFDLILPPENEPAWNENWSWSDVTTYVRLQENVVPKDLDAGLAKVVRQHHQDDTGDRYLLEPITDIRLFALDGSGRGTLVNVFMILGAVILLLAWFNYISLSTARFLERMKEVGVRKLVGASRRQLIFQHLTESFFFNFISFLVALLLFVFLSPWMHHYLDVPIAGTFLDEPVTWFLIPVSIILGTLFSGFYPAIFLSSFKPLHSLKGRINGIADRSTLRKALVVVQLSISVILITAIFAIEKQIRFMQKQDVGISLDQTLIISEPLLSDASSIQKFEPFKNEILQLPSVTGITYASSFPGSEIDWHRTDITLGEENADYRYSSRIISIGTEFLEVFKLPVLTGRNFNPDVEGDKKAMLINEEACLMFGFKSCEEALNKLIFIGSRKFEVIGVVKNYHYRSLQYPLQPILYMQGYPRNPSYAIKISNGEITETIAKIEARWKEAYAGNVFRFHFLDEQFEQQYSSEKQMGMIVAILSVLAMVISFLGLFGLSIYAVSRRTREIGIRKVFGATVLNVVSLLTKEFLKLVIVGGLIAVPVVYQGLKIWLERYAYKMPVDILLFGLPLVVVMLLTLIAISFQTVMAARTNPVDSIKHE